MFLHRINIDTLEKISHNTRMLCWFNTLQPARGGCGTAVQAKVRDPVFICCKRWYNFWAKQPPSTSSMSKTFVVTCSIPKGSVQLFIYIHCDYNDYINIHAHEHSGNINNSYTYLIVAIYAQNLASWCCNIITTIILKILCLSIGSTNG